MDTYERHRCEVRAHCPEFVHTQLAVQTSGSAVTGVGLQPWVPCRSTTSWSSDPAPAGRRPPIAAAKLGKSVAVIERGLMLGGVCVNTGTIPSKTLREAVVYLTGMNQRELYGASYRVKEKITPPTCWPAPSTSSARRSTWCARS